MLSVTTGAEYPLKRTEIWTKVDGNLNETKFNFYSCLKILIYIYIYQNFQTRIKVELSFVQVSIHFCSYFCPLKRIFGSCCHREHLLYKLNFHRPTICESMHVVTHDLGSCNTIFVNKTPKYTCRLVVNWGIH